jgi:outer membrane protein assembly factor BamD (BamD/ComL family)
MTLKTFAALAMAGVVATLVAGCGGRSAEEEMAAAQASHDQARHVVDSLQRKADLVALFTPVVQAYERVAADHPKSEQAEQALFTAAEIRSQYLNDIPGAVAHYKEFAERFPAAGKAQTALFLVGYLYNNALLKPDSAEIAYKKFLELYPQGELATSAQYELQTIGKKPEDLIPNPVIPVDTSVVQKKKPAAKH